VCSSDLLTSDDVVFERIEFVGPQIGEEIIKGGVLSVLLAFVAILFYIAFRFKFIFGISILLSLVHDSIITFGFISLAGLEFNSTSIAAILTVIGYSVNDTVVIFDRIRENMHKHKRMALGELINISINETLSRTINTVLTTLLAISALIIFAGENLFSFSVTTFFGIVIGTYSSIFISAPILILLSKKKSTR
jgi:preprotein translocase subunit SecF